MKKQWKTIYSKMGLWFREHPRGWFVLGLMVLAWVTAVNAFPSGYTFAGERATQALNIRDNFSQFIYENDGRSALFYGLLFVLERLGWYEGSQLTALLALFLFGSYVSFSVFLIWVLPGLRASLRWLVALIYSLNLYTLHLILSGDVFLPRAALYIFLPLVVGAFLRFLKAPRPVTGAWFLAAFFGASAGFSRTEDALAVLVFLAVLAAGVFLSGWVRWSGALAVRLLGLAAATLAVSAYWIPSLWFFFREGLNASEHSGFLRTSNAVFDSLRFMQTGETSVFPDVFPYAGEWFFQPIWTALASISAVLAVLALLPGKVEKEAGKLFWVFAGAFAIFVSVASNALPPFGSVNNLLFFRIPFFDRLIGEGSFLTLLPFLLATLIAFALWKSRGRRLRWIGAGLAGLVLIVPLPFFLGKLHQTISPVFLEDSRQDHYRKATYSPLVRIPDEYYRAASRINRDPEDVKIAGLPSTVESPEDIGRENYPAWRVRAADPTASLFRKPLVSPNEYFSGQWLPARDFALWKESPEWIVKLLGFSNVGYVLYHKDVPGDAVRDTEERMSFLERGGWLMPLEENEYFKLYRIREDMVMPRVWWAKKNVSVSERPEGIQNTFAAIRNDAVEATYSHENPKRMRVKAAGEGKDVRLLVFNNPYHVSWQATMMNPDGTMRRLEHVKAFGWLNGWKVPGNMKGDIVIEYAPTKRLHQGFLISFGTLAAAVIIIISIYVYGKRKNSA